MKDQSDSVTEEIRSTAGSGYHFSDQRAGNQEVRAVYYSFVLFVYGFLAIVALIAAFNIINSIGMGTSARMRQYGAMRAIGTSVRQLKSMVVGKHLPMSSADCSQVWEQGCPFIISYISGSLLRAGVMHGICRCLNFVS